ncbi:uncharacterized protein LOC106154288 [Lingula anatina]|uniref:Uncharacterized protein LOC106154288 n=1 Tax=Lingula anatina TaxID=7574 RepID=A0A2R2MJN7_LINAN|nr:uncharacterized protein LOC106154288 [Lingula anatina]|eukprot:XP_023930282.1 uncharacterized protein LOC106154288 [Lingula anatina]
MPPKTPPGRSTVGGPGRRVSPMRAHYPAKDDWILHPLFLVERSRVTPPHTSSVTETTSTSLVIDCVVLAQRIIAHQNCSEAQKCRALLLPPTPPCKRPTFSRDTLYPVALQKLLRQLQDMKDTAGEPIFDPSCAIFVCNRWDLVPEDAREKALQNVRLAVSEGWKRPMDSSKQIFTLSAKKAWQHSQAGYMTHDYRRLVRGIEGLIPVSLQRRTEQVHRWGKHLAQRTIDHAQKYLSSASLTRDELKKKHSLQEKRLNSLEIHSADILERLEEHLNKECKTITDDLSKYLSSDPVFVRVTSWTNGEAPCATDWIKLEERIENAICKRISFAISSWEREKKHFETLKKNLFKEFTKEFQLIESELQMIENMLERSSETDSMESGDLATHMELKTLMDNEVDKMSIVDFNLAADALKVIAKRAVTKTYVDAQLQEARDHLQMMRESIPQLIASTRDYMQAIKEDQRSKEQLIATYDPVVKKFTTVSNALEDFAMTHLFLYDYNETDVEPDIDPMKGQTSYQGNWTEVFPAILKSSEDRPLKISVKRYKGTAKSKQVNEEMVEMRKLGQQKMRFIPTILGSYLDPTTELPALIIIPRLTSFRVLCSSKDTTKALPGQLVSLVLKGPVDCLIQLADASAYLHKNGLVCLDLSMDTVMITVSIY